MRNYMNIIKQIKKYMVGSVRFGFVFQELVDFRFSVRFGSVRGKIIRKSVRFGFSFALCNGHVFLLFLRAEKS